MRAVAVLSCVVGALSASNEFEDIAAEVNAASAGWTADPATSGCFKKLSDVQSLLGAWQKGHPKWVDARLPEYESNLTAVAPEADFDPRTKWPKCTVIGSVRNQAGCGSCWAFAATASFESARCIATGEDKEFSAYDTAASSGDARGGCFGGVASVANSQFVTYGVVTGGEYGSGNGCLPYVCPPCEKGLYPPLCPINQCAPPIVPWHLHGPAHCISGYAKSYSADQTKAASAFQLSRPSVSNMMSVLMNNGPLSVNFLVFADFPTYTSGVYTHVSGHGLGGHAVAMLGFGIENGQDYWLAKNSWSAKWGDKGFFKIKRGVDECGIEGDISGTRFAATEVVV